MRGITEREIKVHGFMTFGDQNKRPSQRLSPGLFKEISKVLNELTAESGCQAVMLTDTSGTLIYKTGSISTSNLSVLATLAAADYAATAEMARLIGEPARFRSHYYEGQALRLYFTGVKLDYLLVAIFGKETALGMVRIKANKAIELLEQSFEQEEANSNEVKTEITESSKNFSDQVQSEGFHAELSLKLDRALNTNTEEGE